MRQFIVRLLTFLGPLLVFLSFPAFYLAMSGEAFRSISNLIGDNGRRYMVGYAYQEKNYQYLKWNNVENGDRKEIWALGSSRVLEFRSEMFDSSFYNAGFTIFSIKDFKPFLKSVSPEQYPSFLILGLDPWMFNTAWEKFSARDSSHWRNSFSYFPPFRTYLAVYESFFEQQLIPEFSSRGELRRIGLNAWVNDRGFLSDGSMHYGNQIKKLLSGHASADDFGFKKTYSNISARRLRFEYGTEVSYEALVELEQLLLYCKEHRIHVIGFITPFPSSVLDRMKSTGKYMYLDKIYHEVMPLFQQNDFEFYDFSSAMSAGSPDEEMIDGSRRRSNLFALINKDSG